MLIQGPLRFSVASGDGDQGYELFLDFTPEFQARALGDRTAEFQAYLVSLGEKLAEDSLDARNQQGMLVAQQICEQLLPHVLSDELDLEETINIHLRPGSPEVSLVDLLNSPA
jgi:hypothetical protein